MTYTSERLAAGREVFPDLVRSFAILGIVVVNVAFFAYPALTGYAGDALSSGVDKASYFAVNALALMKSFSLFSFMFGVGLAYQMMSAERRGVAFGPRYARRIIGLFVLGLAHVYFAFVGDILIIYAIFGAVLYAFRDFEPKLLIRIGTILILIQTALGVLGGLLIAVGASVLPAAEMAEIQALFDEDIAASFEGYQAEEFTTVAAHRLGEYAGYAKFILPFQGLAVFGYFLWGLAAAKTQAISDPSRPGWRKARRQALPVGLILSAIGAWFLIHADGLFSVGYGWGTLFVTLGAPLSTLGYLGLLAKWAEGPDSGLRTFFARGGTATLTAYLLQSLILSWVFSGYGLGLYGKLSASVCIGIAFATGLFTLLLSSLIRTRFQRGPFEWLLRKWTYLGAR